MKLMITTVLASAVFAMGASFAQAAPNGALPKSEGTLPGQDGANVSLAGFVCPDGHCNQYSMQKGSFNADKKILPSESASTKVDPATNKPTSN